MKLELILIIIFLVHTRIYAQNNSFFPLKTGNKWYYVSYDGNHPDIRFFDKMLEVKREIKSRQKTFFVVEVRKYLKKYPVAKIDEEDNFLGMAAIDSFFYHLRDDTLWITKDYKQFESDKEIPAAVFPLERNVAIIKSTKKDVIESIRENDSTIYIKWYIPNSIDASSRATYKKNIGKVDFVTNWGMGERLVKWVIN